MKSVLPNLALGLTLAGAGTVLYFKMGGAVPSFFLSSIGNVAPVPQVSAPKIDQNVVKTSLQQIRAASSLTTSTYKMQTVVPISQNTQVFGMNVPGGETKLLYIVEGEVKAGIDLSQIKTDQITYSEETSTLTVTLPAPTITERVLDVNSSKPYDYNTGVFGPNTGVDLAKQAQQEGLGKMVSSACQDGILNRANDQAKTILTNLLKPSNPNGEVEVIVTPPSADSCK